MAGDQAAALFYWGLVGDKGGYNMLTILPYSLLTPGKSCVLGLGVQPACEL